MTNGAGENGAVDERKIRAFIALQPPAGWEAPLGALQRKLQEELRSKAIRWTKPEQIHITLRFLGAILQREADEIGVLLRKVCAGRETFVLGCAGLGCFPSVRRPRVLWAGLTGAMESISKLQAEINQATARIGEAPEDRPFTPHLTLARIQNLERTSTERFAKAIERGFRIEVEWNVASVALMQSHLSPQGARYETLAEINLATK